jgi:hypothetical protein
MSGPFDATAIAKAVHSTLDEAFRTIPEGRSHVLLLDGTYQDGAGSARMLYAQRVKGGWDIVLQSTVDSDHGLGAQVGTLKSW